MNVTPTTNLRCVVERITYQNPENGYSVLKVRVKGYSDLVTLVGSLLEVPVGSVLLCRGEWKVDKRYGSQFVAATWEETMPATVYGIEKYLGSGLVKGIGPRFARAIVQRFGTETIDIIETDIERLYEVPNIGRKRVAKIRESWEKQKDIKNVMLFLQGYGVSTAYAAKIYREYGKESIEKVRENPYRLADDIWGIGFKTADGIAGKMGYEKEDPRRCRSGILYTLGQLSDEGHVYAEEEQLVKTAGELLEAGEAPIREVLTQMIQAEDLILDGEAIYLPPFYHAECGTARRLRDLAVPTGRSLFDTPFDPSTLTAETGIAYDEIQVAAIRQAVTSKVMVLTGGPGTGKTTTTQGIIAALQKAGLRVLLAAPTGRAAKRMSEATGMEAKTIHRLLEYNPQDGYKRNDENPLEGDALIVDECSMIDILLMNNLLKAVPEGMRLVLVGDIDQLPSVGAGNVLREHHRLAAYPRRAARAHLPAGAEKPYRDERPRHQPREIPRYEQRPRHGLFLYEGGRSRTGRRNRRPAGEGAPAACLQGESGADSGAYADAAGHRGGCESEPRPAGGVESFGSESQSRRLHLPAGRPCDANTQ